jgi:hypothetical protein
MKEVETIPGRILCHLIRRFNGRIRTERDRIRRFTLMKESRYTNERINLTLGKCLLRSLQTQRPFEDRFEAEIAEGIFEV